MPALGQPIFETMHALGECLNFAFPVGNQAKIRFRPVTLTFDFTFVVLDPSA
ncbi:MAG: hypothetical protein ABI847_16750 [Anaerolineales bacterium]